MSNTIGIFQPFLPRLGCHARIAWAIGAYKGGTVERIRAIIKPAVLQIQSLAGRLTKGITLGVRGLVSDGERILLVRHSYVPGWYLPGGGVEPGETTEASLIRELDEEACIVPVGQPRLMGVYFNRKMAARDHVLVYHVDNWREIRRFVPNHEILEARFFPLTGLPDDATDATRRRVAELKGDQSILADW